MEIVLLLGTFQAFSLSLILIAKKNKTKSDLYLGLLLFIYALTIGGAYLEVYNHNHNYPLPFFLNLSWVFLFLHGPILWFYVKSLTNPEFTFGRLHILHFIPFLICIFSQYFGFTILPASEKILITSQELFRTKIFFTFSVVGIGISTLAYTISVLNIIKKHRIAIVNNYSNIVSIDLTWLQNLSIAALIVYTINVFLFNINLIFPFISYITLTVITYTLATVYVFFLGFFGFRQGSIFVPGNPIEPESNTMPPHTEISKMGLSDDYHVFVLQLTQLMEQHQPYLDPEITLSKLSKLLHVKPDYLSDILNKHLNQTFFDFINKYRVEEFKISCIQKEKKHLSILGIAYDCGFNSKAAFYRAFNKFEKCAPSTYMEQVSH